MNDGYRVSRTLVARIFGGMGNQLFIYAAAKRLALKSNSVLKLDVLSGYLEDPYKRKYCLDHFNIQEEIATPFESYISKCGGKRRYWAKKLNRILPFRKKFYFEQDRPLDPRILDCKISNKLYLQGYWQDEKYFKDIEDYIRKRFRIVTPHDPENNNIAEKMSVVNAVCLHARRNDYEYALTRDYYSKALEYVAERVENPHFFCFSDDPKWFSTLDITFPVTIVEQKSEDKNYEDLWLMTQCRHYIIANSTFSWWGAWLNKNSEKIVISPAKWGYDTAVPKEWIKL